MRSLRFALAAAAMIVTTAFASPTDPKNGAEYVTLAPPQATVAVGKKVEVIEFFAYHCPACNLMEPHVAEWIKKHKEDVNFKRIPFPFRGPNDPEAHLFLTLDAMGKSEELGPRVFHANHVENKRLHTDEAILEWIEKSSGLDKAKFLEYWNSFGVLTKLRRLPQLAAGYKIDGTPSFVIDGRFLTSPTAVGTANAGMDNTRLPEAFKATLDALVVKARTDKGEAAATPATAVTPATPAKAKSKSK